MPMYMQINQLENSHIAYSSRPGLLLYFVKLRQTLFLICRVYKIVKKAFLHELNKTCITAGVLRPKHNKDKMRKKYLNVKIPNF